MPTDDVKTGIRQHICVTEEEGLVSVQDACMHACEADAPNGARISARCVHA